MPMIQRKSARAWSSRWMLPMVTATALLFMSAVDEPAAGSTPRSGTSNSLVPPIQNSMTLNCQITSFTMTTGDPKNINTKLTPPSGSLMFTVVDGQLAMVGPEGAERLRLLSTSLTFASMFFELLTGDGNAQLWSFHHLKNGRILFSGQLSFNNSGPTVEHIEVWTQAGYCDATGGNGQPIRK